MADENQQPVFQIQRIYVKDMSLEQPNSPAIFFETETPTLEIAVAVAAAGLAPELFETSVALTLTARIKDKVAFLVEVKQAGLFEVRNIPAEQLDPLLAIGGPNILYPYLRANIADIITRAGFPPVHLAEINFEAYYAQRLQSQQEAAQAAGQVTPVPNGSAGLVNPDGSAATIN